MLAEGTQHFEIQLDRAGTSNRIINETKRQPYFAAEDLGNWCHLSGLVNEIEKDEERKQKQNYRYSEEVFDTFEEQRTDAQKSCSTNHNRCKVISPPNRQSFVDRANESFGVEHKGLLYYCFWWILVSCYEIPLHVIIWLDNHSTKGNHNQILMLAVNFYVTVFSRTVWFKWLIYYTTRLTAGMAPTTFKLNINKAVVNNGGIHSAHAWWLLLDWISLVGGNIAPSETTRETFNFFALTTSLVVLITVMFFAMPWRDGTVFHEMFEFSHRFGGWFIGGISLINILISVGRGGDEIYKVGETAVWVITFAIFLLVYPWLGILKAYKVDCCLYSPSASIVLVSMPKIYFAVGGTASQLAINVLGEYHSFACLSDFQGDPKKTVMIVARAGDWTTRLIDTTIQKQDGDINQVGDSSHPIFTLSLNRVAAPGFMWLVRNYKRVICVGTGAGIAPIASYLPRPPTEMMILWVGRDFAHTFGPLYEFVVAGEHNNVICIDTHEGPSPSNPYAPASTVEPVGCSTLRRSTTYGSDLTRPDIPALTKAAVELFQAEAVFIVSNKATTFDVCYKLWKVGVHAYGATWDS